ncbi:heparinase II/III domain-containing protein [Streptomyces profundus]|uniref:heparinase II/III domain-containing protein n=1 Tax=Streptomyces profundus TaxID=2867410 RepID=UPI001D16DEA3|nr:heparinase II/III family protein [Streptomyces sp. MA3_2.13]UED84883.1 heparinase II/III-family protein [Streptomyces sp. MA3_2.13]
MPHHQLTDLYPREKLATALPPPGGWRPLPPAADRAAWGRLPASTRGRLLDLTARHLADELPPLPPDGFADFGQTGDRQRYEHAYFARRTRLNAAVLRTLLVGPGAATAELDAVVRLICAEITWCLPAHELSHDMRGDPAPDRARPTVDLFAADTAALLAHTRLLVGDELPPETDRVLVREVRTRVLAPFRERDDWWWLGRSGERLNNWTSWIVSNVLPAALLLEESADTLLDSVVRAVETLDRYLACAPDDGGCDEGIWYWWRSGASYFECLESLADATGDPSALALPSTAALARYPVTAHIAGDWYVNFADGRPLLGQVEPGLLHRYGVRVGEPEVAALAAATPPADSLAAPDVSLARLVTPLLDADWRSAGPGPAPLPAQRWLPDTELLVARERAGDPEGLFLATKGGHNGEFHNHNDVGSFVLAHRGRPVVIDLGVGTYSRKTFGPDRYDIWTMGSAWHNLPLVGGHQQAAGARHSAREVAATLTEASAALSLDLAATWPEEAGVERWERTLTLRRADGTDPAEVSVTDRWRLAWPPESLALHLVTTHPVDVGPTPGSLLLGAPGHRVLLGYDAAAFSLEAEERAVGDPRLTSVWGPTVHRVRLIATTPAAEGHTRLTFRAAPRADADA